MSLHDNDPELLWLVVSQHTINATDDEDTAHHYARHREALVVGPLAVVADYRDQADQTNTEAP